MSAETPKVPETPISGRVCEHGRPASHSWACYEEEYGESKAELMGYDGYEEDDEDDEPREDEA
jgi:hypothetical protein